VCIATCVSCCGAGKQWRYYMKLCQFTVRSSITSNQVVHAIDTQKAAIGRPSNLARLPVRSRNFPLLQYVHTGSGAHLVSASSTIAAVTLLRGKSDWGAKLLAPFRSDVKDTWSCTTCTVLLSWCTDNFTFRQFNINGH